jgi:hypothetical protein
MYLLTFLEETDYPETTFIWHKRRYTGRFAPGASVRFLKPERLIVFLTQAALERVYTDFENELPGDLSIKVVEIPTGATQEEHWQIAQQVNQSIDAGIDVAFDISHGPLCFPLVGLLTATYMRAARNIELHHILYAAYGIDATPGDGVKPEIKTNETPIFDLNEMLSWLEWFSATERFNNTGDARMLSTLLQSERKRLSRAAQGNKDLLAKIGSMGKLTGVITGLSRSLQMIRPGQSLQYFSDLPERLRGVEGLFDTQSNTLIYTLLVERLQEFALISKPVNQGADAAAVRVEAERELVNWYAARELWVETITLAREWAINWLMFQLGLVDFTHLQTRQRVERVLGAESHDYLDSRRKKQGFRSIFLRDIPHLEDLLKLWLDLTEVRNDINHAGMREKPGRPEDLIVRIRACVEAINSLPIDPSTLPDS